MTTVSSSSSSKRKSATWSSWFRIGLISVVILMMMVMIFMMSTMHTHKQLRFLEVNNPVTQALRSFQDDTQHQGRVDLNEVEDKDDDDHVLLQKSQDQQHHHNVSHWLTRQDIIDMYPKVEPIPNPQPADGYNTFSACILLMDDNHRLAEWLAYHYHTLPLRYMIVATDPRSDTSPTSLLNQWRQMGVHILEWQDAQFWRDDLRDMPEDAEFQVKRDRHRGRQKFFYRSCLIAMKHANRTWVSLHDSDEYLVYNHAGGDNFRAWEDKIASKQQRRNPGKVRVQPSRIPPPTTAEEGAMIQYIRQEQKAGLPYYQSPCIGVPRLLFGTGESTQTRKRQHIPDEAVDSWLNPNRYDTLHWRKHAARNDFTRNALGKVLIDVSRVDMEKTPYFMSLHRPIKTICGAPWHNDWDSGLRINHYLGSWESYSFRNDARRGGERSREQWEFKGQEPEAAVDTDDNIRPWVSGFIETHGHEKASQLLQNVGLPHNYCPDENEAWNLLPDKLQAILGENETVANDNKRVAFEDYVREKYNQQQERKAQEEEFRNKHGFTRDCLTRSD